MTVEIKKALIIDDDEDYRNLLVRKLHRNFPALDVIELDPLSHEMPDEDYDWAAIDFILLDYNLGIDVTGLDWYRQFDAGVLPATILLTAKGSEEVAVKAIKLGVDNYIAKDKFDDKKLSESIKRCVEEKHEERQKRLDMSDQINVFSKPNFINRLKRVTDEKNTDDHLLMINPVSYQEIGRQKGIMSQEQYIRHVAIKLYDYFKRKEISQNIFIFREEYIAVILRVKAYKRLVARLHRLLEEDTYEIDNIRYSCEANISAISPESLDVKELERSDFELLSIAMVLCNSLKKDETEHFRSYGDVNLKNFNETNEVPIFSDAMQTVDIENAIKDGRVSANYQPWVGMHSDTNEDLREIYDVRVELFDIRGFAISQSMLIKLMDDAYAKRTIDRWVLKTAASKIMDLHEKKIDNNIKLAVKITISSVSEETFIPWFRELLSEVNQANDYLLIEIDAGQFVRNPDVFKDLFYSIGVEYKVKFILSGIHDMDLYQLANEKYPFEYVKLNISLLIGGGNRWHLNKFIADIQSTDTSIIAINISDAAKLSLATEYNVDYMHGYLIGKPVKDIITDNRGDFYCVI